MELLGVTGEANTERPEILHLAGGSSTGYKKSECIEVYEKLTLLLAWFIYFLYLSKQYTKGFMVSIVSFKCSSTEHYVRFLHDGTFWSKTDDKAGCALGHVYLVIDKSLPWLVFLSR